MEADNVRKIESTAQQLLASRFRHRHARCMMALARHLDGMAFVGLLDSPRPVEARELTAREEPVSEGQVTHADPATEAASEQRFLSLFMEAFAAARQSRAKVAITTTVTSLIAA